MGQKARSAKWVAVPFFRLGYSLEMLNQVWVHILRKDREKK